jgi:hypothetical protein
MNRDRDGLHVPDIILERYRLNELPKQQSDRLTDRLAHDAPLRDRLDALARSDDELRRGALPATLAERLRTAAAARTHASHRSAWRSAAYWALPACAVMAAIVIIAVARTQGPGSVASNAADGDRIKGPGAVLALYRRTDGGSETLADGAIARAGDLLRVGYRAAGRPYGVILSIDGRGTVTMHLPASGDRAAALDRGATVLLDAAYELDDAPQWERFYFITGDTAFRVAPVVDAARRAAGDHRSAPAVLALPHGLEQSTFSLQKEARP